MLRWLITERKVKTPRYQDLQPYLATSPCGAQASRETIARALNVLRTTRIRPWALGCSNWLFASSLYSGKRAAVIMSLTQSARMNVHEPYAYLKDVLTRLPTQKPVRSSSYCRISRCLAAIRKTYSP